MRFANASSGQLQARIDSKDILAIQQLARYHTDIDRGGLCKRLYLVFNRRRLNIPEAHERRDDVERTGR